MSTVKLRRLRRNARAGSCVLRGRNAYGREEAVVNGLTLASLLRRQLPVPRALACLLLFATCSSAQGLEGLWMGTLGTGDTSVRVAFSVERGEAGTLTGALISLDRGTTYRIDAMTVGGSRDIRMQVGRMHGSYEGILQENGNEIVGAWIQRDQRTPLTLRRLEKGSLSTRPWDLQVDVFVPKAPTAVHADGRSWLFYEVHISNWSDEDLTLVRLEVLIGDQTAVFEGKTLKELTMGHVTALAPGVRTAVLVVISNSETFPNSIRHRLTVSQPSGRTPATIECARIVVGQSVVRISPPLGGDGWWAGNGPDSSLHHRGSLRATDGHITVAPRFAFDFARRVAGTDEFYAGEPQDNRSHPTYGVEVVAVADGTIVSVKDGIPDSVPYDLVPTVPLTRDTALGNYVVLDLGGGHFAAYGHLQRHSLRVRPGDTVRRGQVLGLIGNSGATDAPHLHFQVTDGQDPLASEGIPFVFDSFSRDGVIHRDEMPLGGWVIDFKH